MISASPDERRREARHAEVAKRYTAKKRDRPPVSLTAIRIAELRRLFRARHGLMLPDHETGRDAALVMAHHLARRDNPGRRIALWLELQAPWMSAAEASAMAAAVLEKPLRWRADKLAARLQLTEAERRRLRITTIGANDMDKAERKRRRRERDRLARQRRLRAQGAKPRVEYERQSLTRTRPWEALGISRAKWYRTRGPSIGETSASAA